MRLANLFAYLFGRVMFLFVCIFFQSTAWAGVGNSSDSLKGFYEKPINVKFICDFKKEMVDFFDYKNNKFVKREDLGIEILMPVLDKFIGSKIINTKDKTFLYGYFLSIHDVTGKIAPNPIGIAYVNLNDLFCLDINQFEF